MSINMSHYKKYQVYFFLYLAVICELLIIIVERDDAEASLLMQQRMLEEKNRKIILELLKNMPAVAAAGDNQLKVGEERKFTISVKGLGEQDEVTTPPEVKVFKEGAEIGTLRYPEQISDSVMHGATGERMYRFNWKAPAGPGTYELWVQAGTNRVSLTPDINEGKAKVKVGTLEFTREDIRSALDSDPDLQGTPIEHFIERSESLNPDRFVVDVVAEEYDQLQIQADPIVTAIGYPATNEIKVRGTTVDKVAGMTASTGMVLAPDHPRNPWQKGDPSHGKWMWTNTFAEPGERTVTIDARDRRQAGAKSVARPISFRVDARMPVMREAPPQGAFAGETFRMNVGVDGLEEVGLYDWTCVLGGEEVARGSGSVVTYAVPEDASGQSFTVTARYLGHSYQVARGEDEDLTPSSWTYDVAEPIERIAAMSFNSSGEYPINQEFTFIAARCGICRSGNIENVSRSEIRIEVESEDGQDLLDEWEIIPRIDPNTGNHNGSVVKFYLKGKVHRDGTEATVRIRFGTVNETVSILLYPAE